MSTKSFQLTSTRTNNPRSNASLWGWLGLGLLLAVLAIYGVMAAPTEEITVTSPEETTRSVSATQRDPAAESVMAYLRVHETNAAGRPLDPAAQSVLDYIRAHDFDRPATFVDPAAQSVLNYIRAHDSDQSTQVMPRDPNAESVLNYLRAHDD